MANKSAQTVVDRQITLETTLPGPVLTGGPDQASSPLLSNPTSASHPPPAHSHQSYNIHQRVRQHQGHPGGRLNHSPSIRQSWLFPTNRASPSTALPETTSVMTLNQRPHHGRTDASPTAASSATAQSVPPSVVMNHKERRNFSGSARSRLTKIDRLSKMMLNPNSSIPTLADGSPAVFANSTSRRRARLSLQPQKVTPTETSLSSTTSAQTSDQISRSTSHSSTAVSLSSVVSSIPHSSNSYPRHIVMRSTSPHRTIEDHLDDTAATDSFSSSLPSTSAFAAGVDPSHNSESFTPENPEKANRHASMPLPKPGWRLYDLPDVDETDSQTDQGDRLNSANGEERFQYSASNASSTTNLENHSCQYHATHTRQNSTSTFYTMTPNASSLDLSQPPSNQMNQSSIDPLTVTSFEGLSQSPSTFSLPPPAPKAIKNTKSPLALRRSSTLSTCSTSPINSPFNKGSFPKSSLLSSTVYSNKTLTEERQKIILEILRTERSYVDGLVVLQTLFYEPLNAPYSSGNNSGMNTTTGFNLNNSANASGSCAGAGAGTGAATGAPYYASSTVGFNSTLPASAVPLLSKKSVGEIFSNFSEILQINTLLLTQLETRICGTTFSTGWESDEDETDETRDQEGDEGSQRSSKNRRGAKQKLEQVMVTVGTQGGEQEQMLVLDTDWSVGDIFIEIAPFLKMYSNYVKTYTSALTHINDCMSRNERFTEFLKATAKKPECKSLDFQAYLMLPVQRIPRYRMLLESLLRHTPDDHPDHRKLQTAFESMEQTANFVNETIRQHEMFVEMVNLQSRITGMSEPLVIPGRVLLKRGNVWKVCRRNIQLREIILFSDCIVWTSPSMNPLDDTLTFHRKVGLENSTVIGAEDPDPTKNAFQIISPEKSSQVYVDTPKEKEAWMVAIRRATQEYLSAKRTLKISITPMQSISAAATSFGAGLLRREAGLWSPTSFGSESRMNTFSSPMSPDSEVPGAFGTWPVVDGGYQNAAAQKQQQQPMRVVENYNAPVWVPDHSATRCMICTEEFGTIFRRKHHCRACGKVVCHSCSSRTILIKGTGNHSEKVGRACDDCIDSMFPEEAEFSQPIVANQISQELLPTVEQQQRRAEGEIARRTSNQSLDGVMIRPEDYAQEAGASIGATGMVRGFVEAGLNRVGS
ncbi:hypothetical protein BC939DRAFT_195735 [Gamsiella multidivaricata]|uniref:uncharacterized protein n=1 Tax=Gamsiella multidivaricata TaxID=101098 RepID=UPI0022211749|nr:uncharacterized protein BC939DRAFT_195735 [Gamsiella multidivaricata]KAI7822010.1 hypothetical protein BC939DRAFT_195735 [Gamsiella multidivaricata]